MEMTKYDFSADIAISYARMHERKQPISDEMLSAAVAFLKPRPLPHAQMQKLLEILDEKKRMPRGRPSTAALQTKGELAKLIATLPDDKMPQLLRQLVISRLKSGKRFYEYQRWLPHDKAWQKNDRDTLIRIFYRVTYEALQRGSPPVLDHIGEVDDSSVDKSLPMYERAIAITAMLMRSHSRYAPPSLDTLRNLVRDKRLRKT